MKSILSFFAGIHQALLLRCIHRRGWNNTVVLINGQDPSKTYAAKLIDHCIWIDSLHPQTAIPAIQQNVYNSQLSVEQVVARSYGQVQRIVSMLQKQWSLPHIPLSLIDLLEDKWLFRQKLIEPLRRLGIRFPSITENFPAVGKKRFGSSKKGVAYLQWSNPDDKWDWLEEYIDGVELTVMGFVIDNQWHPLIAINKHSYRELGFIELGHSFPSVVENAEIYLYWERFLHEKSIHGAMIEPRTKTMLKRSMGNRSLDEIYAVGKCLCDCMDIGYAPLLYEIILTQGSIYLIEAKFEIGGEFLADFFLSKYLCPEYFDFFLDVADHKKPSIPNRSCMALAIAFDLKPYVFSHYKKDLPHDREFFLGDEKQCAIEFGDHRTSQQGLYQRQNAILLPLD